jgi:hypothetical protein
MRVLESDSATMLAVAMLLGTIEVVIIAVICLAHYW